MKRNRLFLLSAAVLLTAAGQASAEGPRAHWAYGGEAGPDHWAELAQEFGTCGAGKEQSPIDIKANLAIKANLGALKLDWKDTPVEILNNGHTIQANYAPGSTFTLKGKAYKLVQFHFHSPSEHLENGKGYAMEVHMVHKSDDGDLAVVGVLLKQGAENATIKKLWSELPKEENEKKTVAALTINAKGFLPKRTSYWHYEGSLTTPPCSETVNWFVMKDAVTVSEDQIKTFTTLFPNNARPALPVGRRFVLSND